MKGLTIRDFRDGEALALAQVFHDAVQRGAAGPYDQAQRDAWCRRPPTGAGWSARLAQAQTVVAELSDTPVGFMSLDMQSGLIDLAYVAPEMRGTGVAEALYAVLEGRARVAGQARLHAEASHLAERFFLRRGWRLVARQAVDRGGVSIPNARMEKLLTQRATCAAS